VARRRAKKSRSNGILKKFFEKYILTSQTMPLIFVLSTIGILFVLIRMKGIEQDYKFNELTKQVKIEKIENKELKAQRARMLSVKKLKGFSKKFNLKQPDEKHIIIIP
tara:strand:+ start:385 stop:708 length:324 start_codon:yes stop_codon:yes gene_type:complete